MTAQSQDTDRKTVATYIPAYQKEAWTEHADQLGMTQSEFVRTMVQAGRRKFAVPDEPDGADAGSAASTAGSGSGGFEERVTEVLTADEYLSWDELVAELTDNIEDRLDGTLQDLQSANIVRYSGRHDGYTLTDGDER
jgi:hypothetical protein